MQLHSSRLIGVGMLQTDSRWRMKAHTHSFHEMIVILRGVEQVVIRGQRRSAGAGDVLFYPAGVAHEESADPANPFESAFAAFTWADAPADLPLQAADYTGRIRQLIRWIYAERNSRSPHGALGQQVLLQALLAEYLRAGARRREEHELVTRVQGYIHDHLEGPITLEALAKRAGLSKYHFLRTYRSLTGRTPMQEVRAIRLGRAQELILGTSLPLKDIAPKCGFANEYLLSRRFRRQFGTPPGEMRRGRKPR